MLALFEKGTLPLKRINPMHLYRLGNRIDPIWRIKQDSRYRDITRICQEAVLELDNLLDGADYSHVLNYSKKPVAQLARTLTRIVGPQDNRNDAIGEFIYSRLQNELREFEDKFVMDIDEGLTFLATPKGLYDIKGMLDQGEKLFHERLGEICPDAIPDIREGAKCLVYETFAASAFHFQRAHEIVIRRYLVHTGGVRGGKTLGQHIDNLETTGKVPNYVIQSLREVKKQRNPLSHGRSYVRNFRKALRLYHAVQDAIENMVDEMAAGKPV